jgi:hypothetical protein
VSKIIISAAIRGAHKIVDKCAATLNQAIEKYGENQEIGFPNTAYYLPIIYSIMGVPIEKLKDAVPVMKRCQDLLPPVPAEKSSRPSATLQIPLSTPAAKRSLTKTPPISGWAPPRTPSSGSAAWNS